ncbi:cytochrome b5-like Heme/Steroid binding domain-containing protein [Colletotrichum melonis]|uniref:Cytochrome b5-like Heme/Steroid binding domain-containing protein n=1 Tax=Colletotrichum melonis TaxID=1209925 RepID=A0AAI9TUE2_9PEZI|nr:cytochrome b5-like Heme/Steroid binding domain-containing protein [Colletotrichum melonis]
MAGVGSESSLWAIRYPNWDTTREAFEDDKTPVPKPPSVAIDWLFFSETFQMRALGGLRLPEYWALQDIDAYGPTYRVSDVAGAIEDESDPFIDADPREKLSNFMDGLTLYPYVSWATSDFVEVDETKWFKIFRRERWSSYKHPDPNGLSIDIDDDATWAKISRVIELADRILKEAVSHEWLASFLKEDSREVRRDVMVGSKHQAPRKGTIVRVKPVSPESRLSPTEARKVLDDIADTFFWGFYLREEWPSAIGLTTKLIDKNGRQLKWMRVGIEYFQPIFQNMMFQDPEGRQATFLVTKTHGISGHMHRSYQEKHPKEPLMATEVFWDEEKYAEAGISWEMSFFGFSLKDVSGGPQKAGHALFGIRAPWPAFCVSSAGHMDTYDKGPLTEAFREHRPGIPAIVPCAMTTSDFWETHVPKYGYKALRYKGVCVSERVWESHYQDAARTSRAKILDPPYSEYGRLDHSMRMIAQRLRLRRLELRRLRPWYKEEYTKWHATIYAETQLRCKLADIGSSSKSHHDTHESDVRHQLKSVLWPYNHSLDVAKFKIRHKTTSRFLYHAYAYLWLATLPVRKKPTPSSRPTSRPLHPERLSIPKAAGGQELIDLATNQGKRTSVATETYLHNSDTPSHNKELCMENAKLSFLRWKVLGNVSPEVAKGFEYDWRDIRRMMDQSPYDHGWLTYNYRDLPTHVTQEMHYPIGASQVQGLPSKRIDLDDADLPSWAVARPVIAQVPVPSRGKPAEITPPLRHYHVGEIGDHQRVGSGVKWFVHKADGDDRHLIYDFSGILSSEHGWDAATREKLTMRPDPSSPVLNRVLRTGDMNEKVRELCLKNGPIGQVMRLMRTEDIRLAYNRDRLSCVALGNHVFDLTCDLTNFQLAEHMQPLLVIIKLKRQENPLLRAVSLGYNPDVIVNFLRPYQIGIRTQELERYSVYRLRHFTLNEVKWHVYPETGIYTIFKGHSVIDLTDFMKFHPGGMEILQSVAGKDCTREFKQYHQVPTDFLGVTTHVYFERLQVGKIVPEQSPGVISPDQIVIRNQVFSRKADLSRLSGSALDGLRSLLASEELEEYWGKNVTAQMDTASPPKILCRLFDTKWLVVAKVVAPIDTLPFMDDQMLARMDGKVEPWGFHESYVSDSKYIYNLTSYLRYGKPDGYNELLKARAGTTLSNSLQDQELKRRLWSDFQYRIIAQHGPNQDADFDWKRSFRPISEDVPDLEGDETSKVTPAMSVAQAAGKGNATRASDQIVQPIQSMAGTKRKHNGQLKVQKKSIKAVTTSRFALPEQVAAGVKRKSSPTPVRPYKKVVKESRGSAGGPSSGIEGSSRTSSRGTEKPRQEWEWKDLYMYR